MPVPGAHGAGGTDGLLAVKVEESRFQVSPESVIWIENIPRSHDDRSRFSIRLWLGVVRCNKKFIFRTFDIGLVKRHESKKVSLLDLCQGFALDQLVSPAFSEISHLSNFICWRATLFGCFRFPITSSESGSFELNHSHLLTSLSGSFLLVGLAPSARLCS